MSEENKIYSVTELNSIVRDMLESRLSGISIEGEISNFIHHGSGHMYFTLKDESSEIRSAMFKGSNRRLRFTPENGQRVVATGKLSLYVPRGSYQLIIEKMEPAGSGSLQQAFDALKLKLLEEGLFDSENKQTLPSFPKTLGVITSPSGAAIRDILSVLERRYPILTIKLFPVQVQGDTSAKQVANAIARANRAKHCDVLLVSRGGGSIEDLWAFNEEVVARAIANSKIPVVVGVGHETDTTIADFVADVRAPTPSAAAEVITPDGDELLQHFYSFEHALTESLQRTLQQHSQTLDFLEKRLRQQHPLRLLELQKDSVVAMQARLVQAHKNTLNEKFNELNTKMESLRHLQPGNNIRQLKERIQTIRQRLFSLQKEKLIKTGASIKVIEKGLQNLDPNATLKRGYAIISTKRGRVLESINQVSEGMTVNTRLHDGTFDADITDINET